MNSENIIAEPRDKVIITSSPNANTVKEVLQDIKNGLIQFPFAYNFLPSPEEMYRNLFIIKAEVRRTRVKMAGYNGSIGKLYIPARYNERFDNISISNRKPLVVYYSQEEYYTTNGITDLFTENIRLKSIKSYQSCSPLSKWKDDYYLRELVTTWLRFAKVYTYSSLRCFIKSMWSEVNDFPPTVARRLLEGVVGRNNIKNKSILDISSGWGGRLIAAISLECSYLGYDPNEELKNSHAKIIEMFGSEQSHRVIYEGFENFIPERNQKFDIVFSSPPYFDLERYPGRNQSIQNYPEFDSWMKNWLMVCIEKAWRALDIGGYFILYISNIANKPIAEIINLYIEKSFYDSSWCGIILLVNKGHPESGYPVWIWKKTKAKHRRLWNQHIIRDETKLYPHFFQRKEQSSIYTFAG